MEKETKLKTVEMTRRIRDTHHELMKDKTWAERVEFYKEQARSLHEALGRTPRHKQGQDEEAG